MELTKKEEKALKEFIRSNKNDIKIDFEGYGMLKPFLKDRWLTDFDKEKYRKLFFVNESLYYAEQLSNVENFLYPYYKKGFRIIMYEGKLSDVKIPKGEDVSLTEKKKILKFAKELIQLRNIIQKVGGFTLPSTTLLRKGIE